MIPVTSIDILRKLAALAPVDERSSGPAGPPAPAAGEDSPRDQGGYSLGRVDVGRYLAAHGIEYRIKRKGDVDLYVLKECLFDPGHRNGEAAVVSGARGLGYQCFHSSCADRTFPEARVLISGDKKLTEWMEGYDPGWKRKKKKVEKALVKAAAAAGPGAVVGIGPVVERRYARIDNIINPICSASATREDGTMAPAPREVNHIIEFFEKKGDRTEFVPRYAANYLHDYLSPLAYSSGQFWKYTDGVWRVFPKEQIASIMTHALKESVKGKMVEGVLAVLQGLIYVPEEAWEPHPNLINVKNGMLDVKTMELMDHAPEYHSRVQLPVSYMPGAPVGRWYDFLASIFPEDHEKDEHGQYLNYLNKHVLAQQFAGYCLLRDCRYQKSLFLYGTGSNGKSTFLNVIGGALGKENTASLSLTELAAPFMAINLYNMLANLASETNPKAAMESSIFNSCVTGDEITARKIYTESIKFRPFCKFIISMNEAPMVPDKSYAFERRILVINFNYRFMPEEINPRMSELLLEELDGVFNWMVEGLKMLMKHDGFVVGANIQEEIDQMMTRVNPFIAFVEDCCVLGPSVSVRTQDMWDAYRDWCQEGGNRSLGRNKFLDQVLSQFPKVKKIRGTTGDDSDHRVFKGIGLNTVAVEEMRERLAKRQNQTKRKYDND